MIKVYFSGVSLAGFIGGQLLDGVWSSDGPNYGLTKFVLAELYVGGTLGRIRARL